MQKNEKLVKDFYDSFRNKDQVYSSFCHDNIEWIAMDGMPNGPFFLAEPNGRSHRTLRVLRSIAVMPP